MKTTNQWVRGLTAVASGLAVMGAATLLTPAAWATGCDSHFGPLSVTVNASKTSVQAGETINFTICISNSSASVIQNFALSEDFNGDKIDDVYQPIGSIQPGETICLSHPFTIPITSGCLTNLVNVFGGDTTPSCNEATVVLCIDGEGCSAEFWKTNTAKWVTYLPGTTLKSVFVNATDKTCKDIGKDGDKKFTDALAWGTATGTVKDAFHNLMREAVAALLNAVNPAIHYPVASADIITLVNDALTSCDKATLVSLANDFHAANAKGSLLCCTSLACPTCVLGYPFVSANARTSVVFNESEVLAAFSPTVQTLGDSVKLWATDEHAMLLGAARTVTKTAGGSATNNFPLTALGSNPGSAVNPAIGDPNATDPAGRPLFPALYITDITGNPTDRSGDWQYGGPATPPSAVFGTWKGCTNVVDQTVVPTKVTIATGNDPATKNGWNLGVGSDPVPAGTYNLGYGTEVRWNLGDLLLNGQPLQVGHTYRFYFMVHDGDQNKSGGDVGHACLNVTIAP